MSTAKKLVKRSAARSALAAAAMFLHVTSVSSEAANLSVKTYIGYVDQTSEGTWINDLHACFKRKSNGVQQRAHDDEPGLMRTIVNNICPPQAPAVS